MFILLRLHGLGYNPYVNKITFNTRLLPPIVSCWILIFLVALLGLTRIKRITTKFETVFGTALTMVGIYSVTFFQIYREKSDFFSFQVNRLIDFQVSLYPYFNDFKMKKE